MSNLTDDLPSPAPLHSSSSIPSVRNLLKKFEQGPEDQLISPYVPAVPPPRHPSDAIEDKRALNSEQRPQAIRLEPGVHVRVLSGRDFPDFAEIGSFVCLSILHDSDNVELLAIGISKGWPQPVFSASTIMNEVDPFRIHPDCQGSFSHPCILQATGAMRQQIQGQNVLLFATVHSADVREEDRFIGSAKIPLIASTKIDAQWFCLFGGPKVASIQLEITYVCDETPNYAASAALVPKVLRYNALSPELTYLPVVPTSDSPCSLTYGFSAQASDTETVPEVSDLSDGESPDPKTKVKDFEEKIHIVDGWDDTRPSHEQVGVRNIASSHTEYAPAKALVQQDTIMQTFMPPTFSGPMPFGMSTPVSSPVHPSFALPLQATSETSCADMSPADQHSSSVIESWKFIAETSCADMSPADQHSSSVIESWKFIAETAPYIAKDQRYVMKTANDHSSEMFSLHNSGLSPVGAGTLPRSAALEEDLKKQLNLLRERSWSEQQSLRQSLRQQLDDHTAERDKMKKELESANVRIKELQNGRDSMKDMFYLSAAIEKNGLETALIEERNTPIHHFDNLARELASGAGLGLSLQPKDQSSVMERNGPYGIGVAPGIMPRGELRRREQSEAFGLLRDADELFISSHQNPIAVRPQPIKNDFASKAQPCATEMKHSHVSRSLLVVPPKSSRHEGPNARRLIDELRSKMQHKEMELMVTREELSVEQGRRSNAEETCSQLFKEIASLKANLQKEQEEIASLKTDLQKQQIQLAETVEKLNDRQLPASHQVIMEERRQLQLSRAMCQFVIVSLLEKLRGLCLEAGKGGDASGMSSRETTNQLLKLRTECADDLKTLLAVTDMINALVSTRDNAARYALDRALQGLLESRKALVSLQNALEAAKGELQVICRDVDALRLHDRSDTSLPNLSCVQPGDATWTFNGCGVAHTATLDHSWMEIDGMVTEITGVLKNMQKIEDEFKVLRKLFHQKDRTCNQCLASLAHSKDVDEQGWSMPDFDIGPNLVRPHQRIIQDLDNLLLAELCSSRRLQAPVVRGSTSKEDMRVNQSFARHFNQTQDSLSFKQANRQSVQPQSKSLDNQMDDVSPLSHDVVLVQPKPDIGVSKLFRAWGKDNNLKHAPLEAVQLENDGDAHVLQMTGQQKQKWDRDHDKAPNSGSKHACKSYCPAETAEKLFSGDVTTDGVARSTFFFGDPGFPSGNHPSNRAENTFLGSPPADMSSPGEEIENSETRTNRQFQYA